MIELAYFQQLKNVSRETLGKAEYIGHASLPQDVFIACYWRCETLQSCL
jgi:hypothetical protein